jgi:hypothetical protein
MRPSANSICGRKVLVYEVLRYDVYITGLCAPQVNTGNACITSIAPVMNCSAEASKEHIIVICKASNATRYLVPSKAGIK